MSTSLKLFLCLAIAVGIITFFFQSKQNGTLDLPAQENPQYKKLSLLQRIQGRSEHERFITRDPATGEVPSERLMEAREYLEQRLTNRSAMPNISWQERGPDNWSGRTRSILIDAGDPSGNTIFAGGVGGGLWKSTDEGITWNPINDFFGNLAVTTIAQDPNDPDIIYFGTGEAVVGGSAQRGAGVWKSTDGGSTFSQLSSTDNNVNFDYVTKIVVQDVGSSSYVFAATASRFCDAGGIMRSTNGGSSWTRFDGNGVDCATQQGTTDFASDIIIVPGNNFLVASFGTGGPIGGTEPDGIYYSDNNGVSWIQWRSSLIDEGRIILAAAPTDQNQLYAVVEVNEAVAGQMVPRVYKTYTIPGIGVFWEFASTPSWIDGPDCFNPKADWCRGQDFYDLAVAVDPNEPYRLFIGGIDIFVSNNYGFNWTQLTNWFDTCGYDYVHADQHYFLYENDNEFWVGTDGGVFKSSNANSNSPTFDFRGHSYNVTQFYAADMHPGAGVNEYLGGTQDNGSQHFTSPGMNSTTKVGGGDGMFSHIDQNQPNVQVTATANQIIFGTTDNWASQFTAYLGNNGRFVNPSDYDDNLNKYYAADATDRYLRWNNPATGGTSFDIVTVPNFPGTFDASNPNDRNNVITCIRVSPSIPDRVYFGFDNGTIYYVDNASTGTNKTAVQILNIAQGQGHTISCIEIDPNDENHMLATLSNYGVESVLETTNALNNPFWAFSEGNLPDMPVRWAMFNPNNTDEAFVATELGIWSTDNLDGGNTDWQPTNTDMGNVRCDMIKYRPSDNQMLVATHGRGLYTSDDLNICIDNVVLNNEDISGTRAAGQSITLNNTNIISNTTLNAPSININGPFNMNAGAVLETSNVGCN